MKVEDRPPAELLRCPARPDGFPTDEEAWAIVPPKIREPLIRLADAFRANTSQLERVIAWETGEDCDGGEVP